jgi:hypothetical protein
MVQQDTKLSARSHQLTLSSANIDYKLRNYLKFNVQLIFHQITSSKTSN